MNDTEKTKAQLIAELKVLRQRVSTLEPEQVGDDLWFHTEILQNLMEGVYLARDKGGMIIHANSALESMFGYETGELIGKHVSILNSSGEKNPQETAAEIRDSLIKTGVWNGDICSIKKNGDIFWSHANISMFHHSRLGLVWVSVHQDITSRKQADEILREGEKHYRTLIDWLPEPTAVYQEGKLVYSNLAAVVVLGGRTVDDLIGKPALELVHPDFHQMLLARIKNSIEYGINAPLTEMKFIKIDGTVIDVESQATPIIFGGKPSLIVVFRDIAQRKQLQEALQTSEEKLNKAQCYAHVGSWTWDIKTNHFMGSDEMYRIFGIEKESFSGSLVDLITSAVHPDDRDKVQQVSLEVIRQGRPIPVDCRVVWPDGTTRIVLTEAGEIFFDEQGVPSIINGIVQDVTERAQAEVEIQLMAKFTAENPDPILRVASNGFLIYINEAGADLLSLWSLRVGELVLPLLREAVFQSLHTETKQVLDFAHGNRIFAFHIVPVAAAGYANLYGHDITDSRQVQALREAEERYHILFEQSPHGVLLLDPATGKTIEANAIASQQLGYSREEFINLRISDYEALETPKEIEKRMQKVLNEGSDDFETLHRTKSGEIRNIHVWVKMLRAGGKTLLHSIYKDITLRKVAEDVLHTNELRFQSLIEQAPVAIILLRNGVNYYVNRKMLEMLDLKNIEEINERPMIEYFPPQYKEEMEERLQRLALGQSVPSEFESIILRHDGLQFPVQISVSVIQFGDGPVTIVFVTDLTEHEQAAAAIRKSERQYKELFESMQEFLTVVEVILDEQGHPIDYRYLDLNPAAEKFNGFSREQAIGHTYRELTPQIDMDLIVSVGKVALSGESKVIEWLSIFNQRWTRQHLFSPRLGQVVFLGIDITDRKQADRLSQEMDILREIDRLRSDFIGNVSHELRNPLGLILVMITALRKEELPLGKETISKFLQDIEIETRSLQTIVDDLLDISRFASEGFTLNLEKLDLRDALRRIVMLFSAKDSDHTLIIELPDSALEAVADVNRIEQVLRNLLDNACKFSPAGTNILVEAKVEDGAIYIAVSDEGPGVPFSEHEFIFNRFYRVVDRSAMNVPGLGLGLSISFGIVKAHGGKLWVENKPQGGSIFIFTIPVQSPQEALYE